MLGLDIVEIPRFKKVVDKYNSRFLQRVYTPAELDYCLYKSILKIPELAARYAAKEAVVKALGTGMRGMSWKEIEVVRSPLGKPEIVLYDRALGIANQLGVGKIHISLSHTRDTAVAVAMLEYGVFVDSIEEPEQEEDEEAQDWETIVQ